MPRAGRSCAPSPARARARTWLCAIACWASAGFCAGEPAKPAPSSVRARGDTIILQGRIDEAAATAFLALLRDGAITRVEISSGGGLVQPALRIAQAIADRGLDLAVTDICWSSCANYLFPAARRKTLARPDSIGWHGNMAHVLYLHRTGQARWSEAEMAAARELAAQEAALYARLGVDGFVAWFAKLPPWSVADFHALSPADMQRFGIGEVTVRDPQARNPHGALVRVVDVGVESLGAARTLRQAQGERP